MKVEVKTKTCKKKSKDKNIMMWSIDFNGITVCQGLFYALR